MKILNFVLAVLFLLFAFVQVNDPDPVLWILIYGAMAVLSIMAMFGLFFKRVILVMIILYVAYSLTFWNGVTEWLAQEDKSALFDDVAKMQHVYIEEAREFLGLAICVIVLIFFYFMAGRKRVTN